MRKLCSKFSVDNDHIVKTSNGEILPDDEPLFLLRARDKLALPLLQVYKILSDIEGCNDYHDDSLNKVTQAFEAFKKDHPERMKQPSITRGA